MCDTNQRVCNHSDTNSLINYNAVLVFNFKKIMKEDMEESLLKRPVVKVVVLGDIGRSPRMQYHALSLARSGLTVHLIGYTDSCLLPSLAQHRSITVTALHPLLLHRGPKIVQYFLKALWQFLSLLLTLMITGSSDYLLCQNPPAIPTLPACRIYCLITRTKFYVDWHNYAYSIMALSLRPAHPLLKCSTYIERYFGRKSSHNFCVTHAMKVDLEDNWGIRATVLYDRPPEMFRPLSLKEKHDWFHKLSSQHSEFASSGRDKLNLPCEDTTHSKTAFTQFVDGEVCLRNDRPGLLFSSTSWTPDEDFGILLHALEAYETSYEKLKCLPKLICVITGKGPMKEHYSDLIRSKSLRHVKVITPWLDAADYPTMVASADLGICLHTSSSGLDLPMKVVDMFGAGLPVCAFNFKCLDELVKDGINGYTFKDASDLSEQIIRWFQDFPNNANQNYLSKRMRTELKKFQDLRWERNWNERARKFFFKH